MLKTSAMKVTLALHLEQLVHGRMAALVESGLTVPTLLLVALPQTALLADTVDKVATISAQPVSIARRVPQML